MPPSPQITSRWLVPRRTSGPWVPTIVQRTGRPSGSSGRGGVANDASAPVVVRDRLLRDEPVVPAHSGREPGRAAPTTVGGAGDCDRRRPASVAAGPAVLEPPGRGEAVRVDGAVHARRAQRQGREGDVAGCSGRAPVVVKVASAPRVVPSAFVADEPEVVGDAGFRFDTAPRPARPVPEPALAVEVRAPYEVVVPYSTYHVVERPFGLTEPPSVADVGPTAARLTRHHGGRACRRERPVGATRRAGVARRDQAEVVGGAGLEAAHRERDVRRGGPRAGARARRLRPVGRRRAVLEDVCRRAAVRIDLAVQLRARRPGDRARRRRRGHRAAGGDERRVRTGTVPAELVATSRK